MLIPLMVLAAGAIFAGWLGYEYFVGHDMKAFWGDSIYVLPGTDPIAAAHHVPGWVKLLPIIVAVVGIIGAYYAYMMNKELPGKLAARFQGIYKFLLNKWYFDELYDFLFVRPSQRLGRALWKDGDGAVIDGLGPDGVASAARYLAERVARIQSGFVYHYAFAMLIGVAGIVTWYLFTRAG